MEIYLDSNSTTQALPEVVEAATQAMGCGFGNPSSAHSAGQRGRDHLSWAREMVLRIVGANFHDRLVFTSSGTEANNAVLISAIEGRNCRRIITTPVEHSSILQHCDRLADTGVEIEFLPVSSDGLVDPGDVEAALRHSAALVSVQWVNNETGTVQPIEEIATICTERGVYFHTDAAQAIGKLPIAFGELSIDYLTLTGHKFHAPPGIGAVVARQGAKMCPLLFGGSQESGLRAGTENLPGIVGLGRAAELRWERFQTVCDQLGRLRDEFEHRVRSTIPQVDVNGIGAPRVCNTSNLRFSGIDGEALIALLDQHGIRCSQTSACTSQRPEPSYVLRAMGLSELDAYSSVRFSFSEQNSMAEVETVVDTLAELCKRLGNIGGFTREANTLTETM